VTKAANWQQISEYQIFEDAADYWGRKFHESYFIDYLKYDEVPWWVKDYSRRLYEESEDVGRGTGMERT
jgi:hypothetical protein